MTYFFKGLGSILAPFFETGLDELLHLLGCHVDGETQREEILDRLDVRLDAVDRFGTLGLKVKDQGV